MIQTTHARSTGVVDVAAVAQAIADPAPTRMLLALLDGCARTGTELAVLAEITASTASGHLKRLLERRLFQVAADGRHRYYSLANKNVACALEGLSVVAETNTRRFAPRTPEPLRYARTCYGHMAASCRYGCVVVSSIKTGLRLNRAGKGMAMC